MPAMKPGYREDAAGNVVLTMSRDDHHLLMFVLGAATSDADLRDAAAKLIHSLGKEHEDKSDPFDDPELKAYFRHAKRELFPKLKNSTVSLTLLHGDPDPKLCLELGAAILFDKPLIMIIPDHERPVPANLKRVASAIVYGSQNDPAMQQRLQDAINSVLKNDERSRQ